MQGVCVRTPEHQQAINDKRKQTNLDRYGVANTASRPEVRAKMESTNLQRYGSHNPACNAEIQQKMQATNRVRYGTKSPAENALIQKKIQQTNLDRYGYTSLLLDPAFRQVQADEQKRKFYNSLLDGSRLQGKVQPLFSYEDYDSTRERYHEYPWKCLKCDTQFDYYLENGCIPRCPTCYPMLRAGRSQMEEELADFLRGYGHVELSNTSLIAPYELDIYMPDYKVAIEFNGLYWHSELGGGKNKKYHLNKTEACFAEGIDLIHIFEWDWLAKTEIIKSVLRSRITRATQSYQARKLDIRTVPTGEENSFLTNNHLQGYTPSAVCLGLYCQDTLVQIMSFGKPRFISKYDIELLRSCSLLNTSVAGGFSRLLQHYIKMYNPRSILSYCDRSIFSGKGYIASGFTQLESSPPSYWYTKNHKIVESRYSYQKHKLKDKLTNFDPELTEWENMQNNGYDRIWDCGNFVFLWLPEE
jgi:hypothetical protein